jgi:hypothetical protein
VLPKARDSAGDGHRIARFPARSRSREALETAPSSKMCKAVEFVEIHYGEADQMRVNPQLSRTLF